MTELRTERLLLRPFRASDEAFVLDLHARPAGVGVHRRVGQDVLQLGVLGQQGRHRPVTAW